MLKSLWNIPAIKSRYTTQNIKLSMKDFFSKCDQICRKLRIWSHLLKKYLLENSIFLFSDLSLCCKGCYHQRSYLKSFSSLMNKLNIRGPSIDPWPEYNGLSMNGLLSIWALQCTILVHFFSMFHSCPFFMLNFFPRCAFFMLNHFPCCTLFMLHFGRVELFPCCTLLVAFFHIAISCVALFTYCTFFMLQ